MDNNIYKVMNYNVWNGLKEDYRRKSFENFMNIINVDVVAYQELCGYTPKKLKELANTYGHSNSVLLKKTGYPVGITSKHNIEVINKKTFGYWHGFLHIKIKGIDYIVVHLSPKSEKYRLKEAKKILGYIENNCSKNCIVLGDFNSQSPVDKKTDNEYEVIKLFLNNDFFDSMEKGEFKHTYPTKINNDSSVTKERIDFQLVSKCINEKIVSAKIINDELNDVISDHYPVLVQYIF